MNAHLDHLPVVVIGRVGLAAAHLAERNLPFTVLEAGDGPAAADRDPGSPWWYNLDSASAGCRG